MAKGAEFSRVPITGFMVEAELLKRATQGKFYDERNRGEYVSYQNALEAVRSQQPWDFGHPSYPDFVKEVLAQLEQKLGTDSKSLRFYTAVGSPLDHLHGVDGFVEWETQDGIVRVTVDITANPKKDISYTEGLIVFQVPSDGLDRGVDRSQFLEYSEHFAGILYSEFVRQRAALRERKAHTREDLSPEERARIRALNARRAIVDNMRRNRYPPTLE